MCIKCEEEDSSMWWDAIGETEVDGKMKYICALVCDACGWVDMSTRTTDDSVLQMPNSLVNEM